MSKRSSDAEFTVYDGLGVTPEAKAILDRLQNQAHLIELKQLPEPKAWCVRVAFGEARDKRPLAAIGQTLTEAATRLTAIISGPTW